MSDRQLFFLPRPTGGAWGVLPTLRAGEVQVRDGLWQKALDGAVRGGDEGQAVRPVRGAAGGGDEDCGRG